ncbi:MAG: glycosyltransferase [Chitinophagales bacterium]|nr:glycosyltransferase [Chitinophagales bacterium]
MKIIILTPGFAADESDTSCIPALQDFVLGWKEILPEVEIKIIAFQYPPSKKYYRWNGIEVYSAGGKNTKGIFRLLTWRKIFRQLSKWHTPETILISYFLTEATYVAQKFASKNFFKHIAIAAGQDVRSSNHYLKRLRWDKMKVVVFNKKMDDELFISVNINADAIIPMGIKSQPKQNSEPRNIDLLVVGSLISLKQTDVAIKIIAALQKDFPLIKTQIIGEGSERKKLQQQESDFQLEQNVSFTGALKRDVVFEKMQQAKILLHTSNYEGQSTVITEALANGMVVVCFDVGRIDDKEKVKACADKNEMIIVLKNLLHENKFDFTALVPFTMQQTIEEYYKLINE